AGHELHQAAVERPLLVHLVKGLRLGLRQPQHPEAADGEPLLLQVSQNLARMAGLDGVRLENRQRHLHEIVLPQIRFRIDRTSRRRAGRDRLNSTSAPRPPPPPRSGTQSPPPPPPRRAPAAPPIRPGCRTRTAPPPPPASCAAGG